MRLISKVIVVIAALIASAICFGQTIIEPIVPNVVERPPTIKFAPWREVQQTEDSSEYVEEFPSPITSPIAVNNIVPLRVFVPASTDGPVPAVLILHYWGATDLRSERALAQELNRNGIGAAIMTLPYHLTRTPAGRKSGELALQPDPKRLVETMGQATLDARRAIDFLQSRPEFEKQRIGLCGTSLGALVAALTYAVDDRVTHATFVLGGVNLSHIIWSSSLVVRQRDVLRRHGFTEERLYNAIQAVEPLKSLSTRKPASSFVIGGQYDTVIPKTCTEELIAALGTPKVLWLDTGHYGGIFVQRKLMREVAKYFTTEFGGQTFQSPKALYAPTIRLGATFDTGNGFDLGVGLDLLKFDKLGDRYSTLFLTPRGVQIFLGQTISNGLSFGLIGSTHKAGIGLVWSAVL